jgi:putative tryptophan/tyrosine transport system substrate-binding protein
MKRREFMALLGGAATAWPVAARAQQPALPVVGFLRSTAAASSAHLVKAFRQGLAEAGFVEGQNVTIDYRWADDQDDRLAALTADLVRRQAAVIVTNSIGVRVAKMVTATTPLVFVAGSDPVRTGLVPSLNRPGGNVTGVTFTIIDLVAKQLGLLHELVPKADVVAVLRNPNQPELEYEMRDAEEAGRVIGRKILIVKAAGEAEFNAAFATIVQAGAGALLVRGGPVFLNRRRLLVTLANRHALPASYVTRDYPEVGGLMSYGPSQTDAYRRAGIYAARILKGAKPGDLPVDQATRFDLVINLATAKALGLEVPPTLLARAAEVIE